MQPTSEYLGKSLFRRIVPDQKAAQEGDGWIASEGTCRNCRSLCQVMSRTEHSGGLVRQSEEEEEQYRCTTTRCNV